jgi:soluble lytic murein transglycosylase-like protein
MPATARELGVNPADPVQNLIGGARYLRQLLDQFDGDVEKALAAYNAGPGRVRRARGVPPIAETRAYVASIMGRVSSIVVGADQ